MKKIFLGFLIALFSLSGYAQTEAESTKTETVVLSKDNTLALNTYVYSSSTSNIMKDALAMDSKLMRGQPIYLVIDSGGGSIQAGLEMISYLASLDREVITVTVWGASMAFHTVQGLGKRYLLRDGTLMSHKARGGFFGEFPGQLDSRYSRYLKRLEDMDKRVVARTDGKYTLESYRDLTENEYWCDGQNCVDAGFADAVVTATCDTSMSGVRKDVWGRRLIPKNTGKYGESSGLEFYVVEFVDIYSQCPVITGFLNWNIYIDGKPVFTMDPDTLGASVENSIKTGDQYLDSEIQKMIDRRVSEHKREQNREVVLEP